MEGISREGTTTGNFAANVLLMNLYKQHFVICETKPTND